MTIFQTSNPSNRNQNCLSHWITFLTSIWEQFAFSAVRSRKEAHKGTRSWNGVWDLLRLHRNFLDQHPVPRLTLSEQLFSNICNAARVVKHDSHKGIIYLRCRSTYTTYIRCTEILTRTSNSLTRHSWPHNETRCTKTHHRSCPGFASFYCLGRKTN